MKSKREETERVVKNAFERIRMSVEMSTRIGSGTCSRIVEQITNERELVLKTIGEFCRCGEPVERETNVVDLGTDEI
jgi:hypothetical protein